MTCQMTSLHYHPNSTLLRFGLDAMDCRVNEKQPTIAQHMWKSILGDDPLELVDRTSMLTVVTSNNRNNIFSFNIKKQPRNKKVDQNVQVGGCVAV